METVQEVPEQAELTREAADLTKNTMCIVVERSRFGTKRKAKTESVTVDADKALLSLSKCILESPELKSVQKIDSEINAYLKRVSHRSMFRGGVYLIPVALIEQVDDALTEFSVRRQTLVDAAVATYDTRKTETAERLKSLHEFKDAPSKDKFAASFSFEWSFVSWETPTRLKEIKKSLFESERRKAAAKLASVADDCRNAMRAALSDLVDHMTDRLTPDEDGKKKVFHKSSVDGIHDFLNMFSLKDVTNDTELAAVVEQARSVLAGVDVDKLRKDDSIRDAMREQFALLKGQLATLKIDRGTRDINLDADDDVL